jgi:hypothetical protein
MIPDHFYRVQLRRISRQPDYFYPVRMLLLEKPNRFPMGAVPIQNQDEFLLHMPMHQAQESDHGIETYVLLMNLKEQMRPMPHRGKTDPGNHGEPVVPIPTVLHGGLPFRRPCPAYQWLQPIATLVYKQDRPAVLPGLFFTSSHFWVRQVRMASSSRSLARRWGFWGLHPIPRSRYQTRPGWYCTSNSRWITWATRRRVHKSVGNPAALAPRRRISARRCFWSAVRRGGRPGWGLARSASTPCSWSTFFQRETEAGETPTRRLTSRTPLPAWSIRTAIIRRISRASALPLGRILPSSLPVIGGIYSIQKMLLWQGEDQ